MSTLPALDYNRPLLYEVFDFNGQEQRVYFSKSFFKDKNTDQYFLKLYLNNSNGSLHCQGYIYFYLDETMGASQFIGAYIKPEYRNNGFCSLLMALWLKFCLDYGFENIETTSQQRKPFLIYSLKRFEFEVQNFSLYQTHPNTITICRKESDSHKYLYFKSNTQRDSFNTGKVMHADNYRIVDSLDEVTPVDEILLSHIYQMQDASKTYTKTLSIYSRHKKEPF